MPRSSPGMGCRLRERDEWGFNRFCQPAWRQQNPERAKPNESHEFRTLKNRRGETPFHRAVALGIVWMAEEYVRRGLDDWEAVDSKGRTPLEACKDPHAILVLKAMGTQRKMEREWLAPTEPRPGLKPRL